jgi:hypothetical protein
LALKYILPFKKPCGFKLSGLASPVGLMSLNVREYCAFNNNEQQINAILNVIFFIKSNWF